MQLQRWFITMAAGALFSSPVLGDYDLTQVLFLNAESRQRLQKTVEESSEAKKLFEEVKAQADKVVDDTPSPIEKIYYEGIKDSDSRRQESIRHLLDGNKVALMTYVYSAKPSEVYSRAIRRFVVAWAKTYVPTGNPINENKLTALVCGYFLVGDEFTEQEHAIVRPWLEKIASKEKSAGIPNNNWETKRFFLMGNIGAALDKKEYHDYALDRFRKYASSALFSDSTTTDFRERDALSYHVSSLVPMLAFALAEEQSGVRIGGKDLYRFENSKGGSLQKSVHWVDAFALGEKKHKDFVNTTVPFDRERYPNGIWWEPEESGKMYELASGFDRNHLKTLASVMQTKQREYPTWLSLMASSCVAKSPGPTTGLGQLGSSKRRFGHFVAWDGDVNGTQGWLVNGSRTRARPATPYLLQD